MLDYKELTYDQLELLRDHGNTEAIRLAARQEIDWRESVKRARQELKQKTQQKRRSKAA